LATLIFVSGSVPTFAGNIYEEILDWGSESITRSVLATASATSGFGGAPGTEIRGSILVPIAYVGSYSGAPFNQIPGNPTFAYVTFNLKSTSDNTGIPGFINQDFEGSFKISSGINGTGTVFVSGSDITAYIYTPYVGISHFSLNTVPVADFTGSLIDNGQYTSSFGVDLSIYRILGLGSKLVNGHPTTTFFSASLNAGSVAGTTPQDPAPVPEPSTLSLLGVGAAVLAFGAYRRDAKGVAAV
jgi:hypothetical protein